MSLPEGTAMACHMGMCSRKVHCDTLKDITVSCNVSSHMLQEGDEEETVVCCHECLVGGV